MVNLDAIPKATYRVNRPGPVYSCYSSVVLLTAVLECELIANNAGCCHLRSANADVCIVPRTSSTRLGDRSFCVAGPRVRNSLQHSATA